MYKVIKEFNDRDGKKYAVGDVYESENEERILTLSTNDNKYGYPFIKKVKQVRGKKVETE